MTWSHASFCRCCSGCLCYACLGHRKTHPILRCSTWQAYFIAALPSCQHSVLFSFCARHTALQLGYQLHRRSMNGSDHECDRATGADRFKVGGKSLPYACPGTCPAHHSHANTSSVRTSRNGVPWAARPRWRCGGRARLRLRQACVLHIALKLRCRKGSRDRSLPGKHAFSNKQTRNQPLFSGLRSCCCTLTQLGNCTTESDTASYAVR